MNTTAKLPKKVAERNEALIKEINGIPLDKIVPFIGAGISMGCNLPGWSGLLDKLYDSFVTDTISEDEKKDVFSYADFIYKRVDGVNNEIVTLLSSPKTEGCPYLSQLATSFSHHVITTNYDVCIEKVSEYRSVHDITDAALQQALQKGTDCVIHLHGSIDASDTIVLSTDSYNKVYGVSNDGPAVAFLESQMNNTLLFVGCSLDSDRTLDVIRAARQKNKTQKHFAILPYPGNVNAYKAKNGELSGLGISAIYYPEGKYSVIGDFLTQIIENNFSNVQTQKRQKNTSQIVTAQTNKPNMTKTVGSNPAGVKGEKQQIDISQNTSENTLLQDQLKYLDRFYRDFDIVSKKRVAEELVNSFLKKNGKETNLDDFEKEISECLADAPHDNIKILGLQGTGKSTLIALLYKRIMQSHSKGKNWFPLVIDFHSEKESVIRKDIKKIQSFIENNKNNQYIFFVDGIDEYRVRPLDLYKTIANMVKIHPQIVFVFCVTQVTNEEKSCLKQINGELASVIGQCNRGYGMHRIEIRKGESQKVNKVLKKIEQYYSNSLGASSCNKLAALLRRYSIRKVDFRTLLILVEEKGMANIEEKTLGVYLYEHYYNRFGGDTRGNQAQKKLNQYAEYTFNLVYGQDEKDKAKYDGVTISKNSITRSFLIAQHLINIFSPESKGKDSNHIVEGITEMERKSPVLSAITNELFVDLFANLEKKKQETIILGIAELVPNGKNKAERIRKIKGSPVFLAQVCYLLGILSKLDDTLKDTLIVVWDDLYDYLFSEENADGSPASCKGDTYYELLFLFRTVSISRLLSGDNRHEKQFLECILFNKTLNSINRGFHIAYYMDHERPHYLDKESDSIDIVMNILLESLSGSKPNPLRNLNALTVLSFYQSREVWMKNSAFEYKDSVCRLIESVTKPESTYMSVVKEYATNIKSSLLDSGQSEYRFLLEACFNLKTKKMDGWTSEGRSVDKPESISDHIYGSYLLGLTFLPEQIKGTKFETNNEYEKYNKQRILYLILIHDFGKYKYGDLAPSKRGENYIQDQEDAVADYRYYGTFEKAFIPSTLLRDLQAYHNEKGINEKMAKEISNIEMMVTALMYSRVEENKVDAQEWIEWAKNEKQVSSGLGKDIRNTIIEAFYEKKTD